MIDLKPFEFFLVRYVPDAVKREFINIGVVVRAAESDAPGIDSRDGETLVRFTRNWGRVRCLDPDADMAVLEGLETELRHRIGDRAAGLRPFLELMEGSFSNQVRLSRAEGCLAENLVTVAERLLRLHVEPRRREPVSRRSGRLRLYDAMRREFERAGVWEFMDKRIPVSRYLQRADTLRIDCGYRNGKVRMFQAVSLEELDSAKILAFTAARLGADVLRVEGRELELTAICEPRARAAARGDLEQKDVEEGGLEQSELEQSGREQADDRTALYDSGRRILEEAEIRFMTTGNLPQIAETARRELGL